MSSGAYAMLAEWMALLAGLFIARQVLLWVALRHLKPSIDHRIALPEGFKVREKMHYGMAYRASQWIGLLAIGMLIAPPAHLLVLLIDRGWDARIGALVGALLLVGVAVALLDRFAGRSVARQVGLAADWRSRSL